MYRVGGGNIGNTKILAGISRHAIEKNYMELSYILSA